MSTNNEIVFIPGNGPELLYEKKYGKYNLKYKMDVSSSSARVTIVSTGGFVKGMSIIVNRRKMSDVIVLDQNTADFTLVIPERTKPEDNTVERGSYTEGTFPDGFSSTGKSVLV